MERPSATNKKFAADLKTKFDLDPSAVREIERELRHLLADSFALYIKTKTFHWHISGRHFRDYHLLLDEQADQVFAITDEIAERARKLGAATLRSIGDITRYQRLKITTRKIWHPRQCSTNFLEITGNSHAFCD